MSVCEYITAEMTDTLLYGDEKSEDHQPNYS